VSAAPGTLPSGDRGPHAFVDDLDAPVLSADDTHHLARVVRLREGDALTVSDGRGAWRACRFGTPLTIDGPVVDAPRPTDPVTVAFALVKGSRPELVVQKLTELGVDRIVAFEAERSVVRWDEERTARQLERLRRVAREAAMQSRRCVLPDIEVGTPFGDLVATPGAVLADRGGRPLRRGDRLVLVGPEGGWTEGEREGRSAVGVGPHILRAETAAIAVGTLLTALRAEAISHGK
jgi:16S rRNA (uracil1498-N3)-methyltransferase